MPHAAFLGSSTENNISADPSSCSFCRKGCPVGNRSIILQLSGSHRNRRRYISRFRGWGYQFGSYTGQPSVTSKRNSGLLRELFDEPRFESPGKPGGTRWLASSSCEFKPVSRVFPSLGNECSDAHCHGHRSQRAQRAGGGRGFRAYGSSRIDRLESSGQGQRPGYFRVNERGRSSLDGGPRIRPKGKSKGRCQVLAFLLREVGLRPGSDPCDR
mmetsp:Transcript_25590/g.57407  ORF Transcript_25590/g.57407 Transcript_25590/m.57407 type:complete len:214 (+) Transcript_25590:173-814(+)